MMLARPSRGPCWKTFTTINYPPMRCLSLPELSLKPVLTRYDSFLCCPTNGLRGVAQTANGIIVMTMAAACFPDAQLRVQEELDIVVGMDRRKLTYPPFRQVLFISLDLSAELGRLGRSSPTSRFHFRGSSLEARCTSR